MTLHELMNARGMYYVSVFTNKAEDIKFNTTFEIFEALGYIVSHMSRFDFEIPEKQFYSDGYMITDGLTSGGNTMKRASEYRIYFDTTVNMPFVLSQRLQQDNYRRITGSKFVESCSLLGFIHGGRNVQNFNNIINNINTLVTNANELEAFKSGLNL